MDVNKAKTKTHPQLSYDALLIHGLMIACVAGTVTAGVLLPSWSREQLAALGTGVAAALVLGAWSLLLAVRAWRKEEPSRWPVVVVGLTILEVLLCGIVFLIARYSQYTLYDWVMFLGLPVFIPVFLLASLIAAPIAWWRTRRAEKKETAKSGAPWTLGRRWKRRLAWYCPVAAVLFAIALPIPLFVFCACGFGQRVGKKNRAYTPEWHGWVTEHTPEILGNAAAWLLSCSEQPWFAGVYAQVLESGRVSSARLVAELDSKDWYVVYCAAKGLRTRHQHEFFEITRMVCQGSKRLRSDENEGWMGFAVQGLVYPEEKDRYLDPQEYPRAPLAFLAGLLNCGGEFAPYVSKLTQFCDGKAPNREAALKRLAYFAEPQKIENLWAKYLADKDAERREQAIACIAFIQDPDASLGVLAAGLESKDETLRRDLARNIQDILIMGYERADQKVLARLVKALLPFLDGPDINVIQDSAWVLSRLIQAPELEKRVRDMANWTTLATRKSPASLTPEARKLLEDLRAAARQWLGAE